MVASSARSARQIKAWGGEGRSPSQPQVDYRNQTSPSRRKPAQAGGRVDKYRPSHSTSMLIKHQLNASSNDFLLTRCRALHALVNDGVAYLGFYVAMPRRTPGFNLSRRFARC